MLVQYVGDPSHGGDGPNETSHMGFDFKKNGPAVPVEMKESFGKVRREQVANAIRFFKNSNHFRIVTPEMLREDARRKADEARKAAAEAEAMAKQASELAEKELAMLAGRAEDEPVEDEEGDDDASDEATTDSAEPAANRGPRRQRRG